MSELQTPHERLELGDRTGQGVFETMIWRKNPPQLWPLHMLRMQKGAQVLGLPPVVESELVAKIQRSMGKTVQPQRLRIDYIATGQMPLLRPTGAVLRLHHRPLTELERAPLPIRVLTMGPIRNPLSLLAGCKHIGLAESLLWRLRAMQNGADDVLLCSTDGMWSELSTSAVIFGFDDGRVATPDEDSGALPSTTVLGLQRQGMDIANATLHPTYLRQLKWAMAVNAVIGGSAILQIDGKRLGDVPQVWLKAAKSVVGANLT